LDKRLLDELGFKRTLNAAGHVTIYGGSCPDPEVVEAMDSAANLWVDMRQLERNAGGLLSRYLGCEDGIVTSGAYTANSMAVHAALALAGEGGKKPDAPNIVIQTSHVTKYAESFVTGGIRLKEVKRKSKSEALSEHIDGSTIAVVYVLNDSDFEFDLRETVEACRKAGIPAIVDAAVVDPVVRGVKEVLAYAPDAVSISGGKGLNGPNSTGLLIGKNSFISKARDLAFPNYGPGRAMKVSKEQIVGLMMAVKLASRIDDQKIIESWKKRVERVRKAVDGISDVRTETLFPWNLNFPQPIPRVGIFIETPDGEVKAEKVKRKLAEGNPSILVRPINDVLKAKNSITLDLRPLREGEVRILSETLAATLRAVLR
jgi:D-glucosaminate-6-phosphate ammonia-lyase